ncbi:MAG: FAD-dependent oxidoreductase [Proteobacteria bacterium]|nr:FAD-dependent oxidoreductase [Pseudomonadota bacterium]MBU1060644.1 FAD-dependent oxidoreductase [Pseudomonadota bacterium]
MPTRDLTKLSADILDVLVIGGGAHGATIAYHVSKAGYRTALVEKNDFCGATSASSLKILHGGLRYLQHLNIKRMRHSITARREMMGLAPYLVQPLACMMPLYGKGLRGKRVMQAALFLNDCIGWDRNDDLPPAIHLPRGHIVSEKQCRQIIPDIESEDLHGAGVWYDALAVDTERLILEYILGSIDHGAMAVNYAEAKAVAKGDDDLYQVTIQDRLNNETHQLKSRFIVNASGPWLEQSIQASKKKDTKQRWALALNIVSRKKIFTEYAVALEGHGKYEDKDAIIKRGKRLYFFVPWRGHTMIGTEYRESIADPDDLEVKREMIQNMVEEVNAIYPSAQLTYEDISFFHAGLLPMRSQSEENTIQMEKNSTFFSPEIPGFSRVLSVKGVKYTTAPHIAHEILKVIQKQIQPESGTVTAKKSPGIATQWNPVQLQCKGLLERKYGRRAVHILSFMENEEDSDIWIDEASSLLKAEVKYLLSEEMACKLADIVLRRTGLGTAEYPGRRVLEKLVNYMGGMLAWNEARKEQEIEDVLRRYAPLVLQES